MGLVVSLVRSASARSPSIICTSVQSQPHAFHPFSCASRRFCDMVCSDAATLACEPHQDGILGIKPGARLRWPCPRGEREGQQLQHCAGQCGPAGAEVSGGSQGKQRLHRCQHRVLQRTQQGISGFRAKCLTARLWSVCAAQPQRQPTWHGTPHLRCTDTSTDAACLSLCCQPYCNNTRHKWQNPGLHESACSTRRCRRDSHAITHRARTTKPQQPAQHC